MTKCEEEKTHDTKLWSITNRTKQSMKQQWWRIWERGTGGVGQFLLIILPKQSMNNDEYEKEAWAGLNSFTASIRRMLRLLWGAGPFYGWSVWWFIFNLRSRLSVCHKGDCFRIQGILSFLLFLDTFRIQGILLFSCFWTSLQFFAPNCTIFPRRCTIYAFNMKFLHIT